MHRSTAFLLLFLFVPLAAGSEPARESVWTVHTTVTAVVEDHYAIVTVLADIQNRGPDPEFPFQVLVPEDAFVTGMSITRDGHRVEASIKEAEAARSQYDAHKRQEETGAIVEKRGTDRVAFLVNVAEFTSVQAELTYETYLRADRGVYTLPLEAPVSSFGEDLGARFDVTVLHSDGLVDFWSAPMGKAEGRIVYEVGPRAQATAFTASYIPRGTSEEGSLLAGIHDGRGYFAHRLASETGDAQLPLDMVLVLDTSGSMRGEKIAQLRDAATQVVASMGPEDHLRLVPFSSDAKLGWSGRMDADGRQGAQDAIERIFAGGSTNVEDALRTGFEAFDGEGLSILVLLTDGQATTGITDPADLRAVARHANDGATVYTIAFGEDADWGFLQGLARDHDGIATKVASGAGAEVDLRRFLESLTAPVLRDVAVLYDQDVVAHQMGRVLFAGSEVLVVGTYPANEDRLSGVLVATAEGTHTRGFDEPVGEDAPAFLPRLVAYQQILDLQRSIDAGEGGRDRLVELALEHGFVTDHTSLVLTLDPSDVRPFSPEESQSDAEAGAPAPYAAGPSAPSAPSRTAHESSQDQGAGGGQQAAPAEPETPSGNGSQQEAPGLSVLVLLAALAGLAVRRRSR